MSSSDDDSDFTLRVTPTPGTGTPLLSLPILKDVTAVDGSNCQRSGPCIAGHGIEFHSRITPSPSRSSRRRSSKSSDSTSTKGFGTPDRTILNSRQNLAHRFEQEARLTTLENQAPELMGMRPDVVVKSIPFQQRIPTSDYSSDDDTFDKSPKFEMGCGSPRLKAFEGRGWIRSPRTGYTYVDSPTYRNSWTPDRETPMPHMARLSLHDYNDGEVSFVRPRRLFTSQERSVPLQNKEFSADEDELELSNYPTRRPSKLSSPFIILYSVLLMLLEKPLLVFKAVWSQISTLKPSHWKNKFQASSSAFRDTELSTRSQSTPSLGRLRPRMLETDDSEEESDNDETKSKLHVANIKWLWNLITFRGQSNRRLRRKSFREGSRRSLRLRGIQADNIAETPVYRKRRQAMKNRTGKLETSDDEEEVLSTEALNQPLPSINSPDEDENRVECKTGPSLKNLPSISSLMGFESLTNSLNRNWSNGLRSISIFRGRDLREDNFNESQANNSNDHLKMVKDEDKKTFLDNTSHLISNINFWISNSKAAFLNFFQSSISNLSESVKKLSSRGVSKNIYFWLLSILIALVLLSLLSQTLFVQTQGSEKDSNVPFVEHLKITERIQELFNFESRVPFWFSSVESNHHVGSESDISPISRFKNFILEVLSSAFEAFKSMFVFVVSCCSAFMSGVGSVSYSFNSQDRITNAILESPLFAKGMEQLVQRMVSEKQLKENVDLDKVLPGILASHPKFDSLVTDHLYLRHQLETLQASLDSQSSVQDLESVKLNLASVKERHFNHMEEQTAIIRQLTEKIIKLDSQIESLQNHVRSCCLNTSYIEELVTMQFSLLTNNCEVKRNQSISTIREEFDKLVQRARVDLSEDIFLSTEKKLKQMQAEEMEQATQTILQDVLTRIHHLNFSNSTVQSGFDKSNVEGLIQSAIATYDADKTGLFDFALESAGGSVVSTRCTESYLRHEASYSLFGVPLWWQSNNPRVAIQPGVNPGECWAFKGSEGFLVVQLSTPVTPTRFSLEHIPKSMSPTGQIDSAPKEFEVYGYVESELEANPEFLGRFTYDIESSPIQFFSVQNQTNKMFRYIELKIISNHGNVNYTCLYRFRVHGAR